jgi:hypothetical protein
MMLLTGSVELIDDLACVSTTLAPEDQLSAKREGRNAVYASRRPELVTKLD